MIGHICDIPNKMMDHFVQQMQFEVELSMVGEATYFPNFKVKKMKEFTFDSQSIYTVSNYIQMLWSNQMLKDGNEDVN